MVNTGQNDQRATEDEIKCIHEKSQGGSNTLNFSSLVMASRDIFSTYSLNECVMYCLQHWPDYPYVLISYEDDVWSKDEYNCMCAYKTAFHKNAILPEYKCNNKCPGNKDKYR